MKKLLLPILFLITIITNSKSQSGVASYPYPLGINNDVRYCLKIDASDNKWVGSRRYGLGKFDGVNWTIYDTLTSGMADNYVCDLAFDAIGAVWVATNKGLSKFDGTNWTTFNTLNSALPSDSIKCVYVHNTDVWVGTSQGLLKYNGSTWTIYNSGNSPLLCSVIQCINAETNGTIWIGTKAGLYKLSGTTWTNYGNINPYLTANFSINFIYIDDNNDKWIVGWNTIAGRTIYKLIGNQLTNISFLFNENIFASANGNFSTNITKGPQGGIAFSGSSSSGSGIIEIVSNQIYLYRLSHAELLLQYDANTNLMWNTNSFLLDSLHSFNFANYTGSIDVYTLSSGFKHLDVNMVSAGLTPQGDMFWNIFGNTSAAYEVPKGSGRNAAFASALWMGGYDNGGTLHQAAQTYRQGGIDFQLGPMDTISGTVDSATSAQFNRIWKIDRYKVEQFKHNFTIGNVQNGTYIPDYDIITWPAQGAGNFTRNLAPFVDVNHDGVYNPLVDGDYPDIKGDQMCYWIFNDSLQGNRHYVTNSPALQIEVHGSAYAYVCPSITDSLKVLNYTTFYHYDIINRSQNTYHNTHLGIWNDTDLGWYGDDFVGSNAHDNYGYTYNGTYVDGSGQMNAYGKKPPMISTVIFNGPLAQPNDGIDNNNNGTIDEPNERNLMTSFLYFNNNSNNINGNPGASLGGSDDDYYQFMTAHWKNGAHITYGGDGTDTTSFPTNFMYNGTPDSLGLMGWTEVSANNPPGDRRYVMGCGPFNLSPGQSVPFDYALVYTRDTASVYSTNNIFNKNQEDVHRIQRMYAVDNFPSCLNLQLGVNEIKPTPAEELTIYPNPNSGVFVIKLLSINKSATLKIINVLGEVVYQSSITNNQSTININQLQNSIYFVQVQTEKGLVNKKIIKE